MNTYNNELNYYDTEDSIRRNLNIQRDIELSENMEEDGYTTNIVHYNEHIGVYISGIKNEISQQDKLLIEKFMKSVE